MRCGEISGEAGVGLKMLHVCRGGEEGKVGGCRCIVIKEFEEERKRLPGD